MINEQVAKAQQMRDGGMTYQEIGDMIGISLETVRYNLNPAVRQRQTEYRQNHTAERAQCHTDWYRNHKEEKAQYHAKWYQDHAKGINQHVAKYYRDHKAEKIKYAVEYRQTHKAEIAQYKVKYHQTHKPEKAEYQREHLSERAAYQAKRRMLKVGALIGATANQLNEIKEIYRRAKEDFKIRCYLCGKLIPLGDRHVDHIIPLSKGRAHRPSNLAVACDFCNMSKHNKLPQEMGMLL